MPKNYANILQIMNNGYSFDELQNMGVSRQEIVDFVQYIDEHHLTVENAKALNIYSRDSDAILSIKNDTKTTDEISANIMSSMSEHLEQRGLTEPDINKVMNFVNGLDYSRPLHENFEEARDFLSENDIKRALLPTINTAIQEQDTLHRIDSIITELDDTMSKSAIQEDTTLYRAIKLPGVTDETVLDSLRLDNDGYTSTSPSYDASFAKYDEYNVVLEMHVPAGTHGIDLAPFSDYDSAESEVLLSPNKLSAEVIQNIVDDAGKDKILVIGEVSEVTLEKVTEIDKDEFVIE